jgi:hypothetical protein
MDDGGVELRRAKPANEATPALLLLLLAVC